MKRTLALVLCLVMLVGCLAACGEKTPQESGKETTPQQSQESKPGESKPGESGQATQPQTEDPNALPAPGTLPFAKGETITIGIKNNLNVLDYKTNGFTKWLEEQSGLNLEFVTFSSDADEARTQLRLMMAGDEKLPDILIELNFSAAERNQLGEDGYFIDLLPYFDTDCYFIKKNLEEGPGYDDAIRANWFNFGKDPATGAMYGMCKSSLLDDTRTDSVAYKTAINQKWLDAVGKKAPTTVEELYDVLVAFRDQDPNGNGQKDEIPMIGPALYRTDVVKWVLSAYEYIYDSSFFAVINGKLYDPYMTDEYRQGLIYLNKLYKEGLLSPLNFSVSTDAEMKTLWTPADGTAILGVAGGHPTLHMDSASPLVKEYVGLGALKAATSHGGYGVLMSENYAYTSYITSDCENPALAFRLLDLMMSTEGDFRMRYGVRGVTWDWCTDGELNKYGTEALYKVGQANGLPENDHWSEPSNDTWHVNIYMDPLAPIDGRRGTPATPDPDYSDPEVLASLTPAQWRTPMISNPTTKGTWAAPQPAERILSILYTPEENEAVTAVAGNVSSYMKEARAFFISGVLDPNSDADWNKYIAQMKAEGAETWLQYAQKAYTRMTQ